MSTQVLQHGGKHMRITFEFEQEVDGRWIAEIPELPGVMAYGATRQEAWDKVTALGMKTLAERLENGSLHVQDVQGLCFA